MLWPNLKDDLVKRLFVSLILYSIVVCFQNIKKCQSQLGCYNRITNKKIRVNLTNLNQITKMICHLICLVVKKKRNCATSTIYIYIYLVPNNISPPTIPLTKGTGEVFGNCCIQEEGTGKALEVPSPLVWLPWRRPRTSPLFLGRDNTLGRALPKAQQIERSNLKQRYRCKACTLL